MNAKEIAKPDCIWFFWLDVGVGSIHSKSEFREGIRREIQSDCLKSLRNDLELNSNEIFDKRKKYTPIMASVNSLISWRNSLVKTITFECLFSCRRNYLVTEEMVPLVWIMDYFQNLKFKHWSIFNNARFLPDFLEIFWDIGTDFHWENVRVYQETNLSKARLQFLFIKIIHLGHTKFIRHNSLSLYADLVPFLWNDFFFLEKYYKITNLVVISTKKEKKRQNSYMTCMPCRLSL